MTKGKIKCERNKEYNDEREENGNKVKVDERKEQKLENKAKKLRKERKM